MFDNLSEKLQRGFKNLRGEGRLTAEQNLKARRIAIVIPGNPQRPAVHRYIDRVIAAVKP